MATNIKLNKNDVLEVLADRALANAREEQEFLTNEVNLLMKMSKTERDELMGLAHADSHIFSRYGGGVSGDIRIYGTVREVDLPDWFTKRQRKITFLEGKLSQLRHTMDTLRDTRTRRMAVIAEALGTTEEGRALLESIGKVAIPVILPEPNEQGGTQ